ncbi:MAG: ribbon-helix-helix protein, CopG family [Acidimicrobiales bacterium]
MIDATGLHFADALAGGAAGYLAAHPPAKRYALGSPAAAADRSELYIHIEVPVSVYTMAVRRINIYIDEDLDDRANREARRRRISKAALIRESLVSELGPARRPDPVDQLVGLSDAEPTGDIDSVIYRS